MAYNTDKKTIAVQIIPIAICETHTFPFKICSAGANYAVFCKNTSKKF